MSFLESFLEGSLLFLSPYTPIFWGSGTVSIFVTVRGSFFEPVRVHFFCTVGGLFSGPQTGSLFEPLHSRQNWSSSSGPYHCPNPSSLTHFLQAGHSALQYTTLNPVGSTSSIRRLGWFVIYCTIFSFLCTVFFSVIPARATYVSWSVSVYFKPLILE